MSRLALTIGEYGERAQKPLAAHRRQHWRWQRILLRFSVLILLLGGSFAGITWLRSALLFSITRVETAPYRYTSAGPLEELMTSVLGRNIFSGAAGEIAHSAAALPWVKRVSVERRLPATLRIVLEEWRPLLAVASCGQDSKRRTEHLVMLEDGRVVAFPAQMIRPALPVLTGVTLEETDQVGIWRLAGVQGEAVRNLTVAIAQTGLETVRPVDFIVAGPDGFALVLRGKQGRLLIGKEDFAARLKHYLVTRDQLTADMDIDLRFQNKVTIASRA